MTFLPPDGSREKTMVVQSQHRESLRRQAFARMKEGIHLGGHPTPGERNFMTASTDSPCALVDTNVVVYAYDLDEPRKHKIAHELIEQLSKQGRFVWSTQVFNEFCSAMMGPKRKTRLSPDELAVILRELSATGDAIQVIPALTFRALEACRDTGFLSGTHSSGRRPLSTVSGSSIPRTFRTAATRRRPVRQSLHRRRLAPAMIWE